MHYALVPVGVEFRWISLIFLNLLTIDKYLIIEQPSISRDLPVTQIYYRGIVLIQAIGWKYKPNLVLTH